MFFLYLTILIFISFTLFSIYCSKYQDPYRDIYFIMGKPGSGKSTFFVNRMKKYIKINEKLRKHGKKEWTIYTDMAVNIPGIRLFNPKLLKDHWPEEKCVIFIDEINLIWDSRKFKTFDEGFNEFFKLHRHAECIIYCASQAFDADLRVRQLTTHILVINNIFNVFALVRPVKRIFPHFTEANDEHGSDIVDIYKLSNPFNWRFYNMPKYFKYFNSYIKPYRPYLPYDLILEDGTIEHRDGAISSRIVGDESDLIVIK